jgi:hypothetical protein
VPQEENSPSMNIAQVIYKYQRGVFQPNIIFVVTLSIGQHPKHSGYIVMQQLDNK